MTTAQLFLQPDVFYADELNTTFVKTDTRAILTNRKNGKKCHAIYVYRTILQPQYGLCICGTAEAIRIKIKDGIEYIEVGGLVYRASNPVSKKGEPIDPKPPEDWHLKDRYVLV